MPTVCNITFVDNPERVFYGGQLLCGRVDLSTTNSKNVRGIYVQINGEAFCEWTEGTGDTKKTYTGNETYLNERVYLIGSYNGDITIPPGSYNYDFQCSLPVGLPTSLEAEYGHIRYMVNVVLDRPMWPDQEYECMFTVIKPVNLNLDRSLRLPGVGEEYKTFYPFCCIFCCCPSEPMHIVARIPVRGYTPGQTINLEIEVINMSDEETNFSVQLWKYITFRTYANSSDQKEEQILILEKGDIGFSGVNTAETFRVSLRIPPISPTDMDGSNICSVRYFLRVIGPISGCHNDATVEIPITIGSYPILDEPNTHGFPTAPSSGGYIFPVSTETGPIVQQPTAGFNAPSAPGEYPEPTEPLLPSNGTAPYPPLGQTYPNAAPPYPGNAPPYPAASNSIMPPLPSASSAPSNPSAPYPEDDPPTYEQATKKGDDGKSFRPTYPVYRRATSYSSASNE